MGMGMAGQGGIDHRYVLTLINAATFANNKVLEH